MKVRFTVLLMACAILAFALGPPQSIEKTSLKQMANVAKMQPNSATTTISEQPMATFNATGLTAALTVTELTTEAAKTSRAPAINWADGAHRARSGPMKTTAINSTVAPQTTNQAPATQLRC